MIKSKMGFWQIIALICFIYFHLSIIRLTWHQISNQNIDTKAFWALFLLFFLIPPTPLLLYSYYNSFIIIDLDNKTVKVKKIFGKFKSYPLKGDERYIKRGNNGGKMSHRYLYVINDEKVLFAYIDVFTSNYDKIEEGLNEIGIRQVPYDGHILLRDLLNKRL
jgi:hypothetical protein